MKISCKVALLSTEKKSNITLSYLLGERIRIVEDNYNITVDEIFKNIYIASSSKEIKAGDWFLSDERNRNSDNNGFPKWKLERCSTIVNSWIYAEGRPDEGLNPYWCFGVILTTDKSLTLEQPKTHHTNSWWCGENIIDKFKGIGFGAAIAHWDKETIKEISYPFVKYYIEEYNKGNAVKEVLVESKMMYRDLSGKHEALILLGTEFEEFTIVFPRKENIIKEDTFTLSATEEAATNYIKVYDGLEDKVVKAKMYFAFNNGAAWEKENNKNTFSDYDMIAFGNFIRDNYHGVGAPKLQSYHPEKYPSGTIEEIFIIYKNQNK